MPHRHKGSMTVTVEMNLVNLVLAIFKKAHPQVLPDSENLSFSAEVKNHLDRILGDRAGIKNWDRKKAYRKVIAEMLLGHTVQPDLHDKITVNL